MISKAAPSGGVPVAPSRTALRILRKLALAGSALGAFGAAGAASYDLHGRIRVAQQLVENKRTIQTSIPQYDATAAAKRLAQMFEAAESGEFVSIGSLDGNERRRPRKKTPGVGSEQGMQPEETITTAPMESLGEHNGSDAMLHPSQLGPPGTSLNDKQAAWRSWPPVRPSDPRQAFDSYGRSNARAGQPQGTELGATIPATCATSQNPASSVAHQMEELLNGDQPIEAGKLFLDTCLPGQRGISLALRRRVQRTFHMNCKQENVFMARGLFLRLDEIDEAPQMMWEMLIFALAKKGCIESVTTLYIQFKDRFPVRPMLLDVLLRCLVESRRLTEAKSLLFGNLHHDRDCGLYGAYLAGLWRKTRSIELLNGQLRKLLNIIPRIGRSPSDKLFNPVLKAYIELGKFAEAETLVDMMITQYKIPLRCRTKGLMVYGKSLSGDWDAVKQGLQEMHDSKSITNARDFVQIFDRIFLEYWVSHSGQETRDFLFYYIDKFRLVPDRVLYKHVLEAFVEKGDENMINEFTTMAQQRSWNVPINEKRFLDILRSRHSTQDHGSKPIGFWQMLQAARTRYGHTVTSQRTSGYDQRSPPTTDVSKLPFTDGRLPWYERAVEELTMPRCTDSYQKLEQRMVHFLNSGKAAEAVACFESAKNSRFFMRRLHLELGVIAVLLQYGISAAQAFIEAESEGIVSSFKHYPELFRHIMDGHSATEVELVKMAVFRFYEICARRKNLTVKHHITTATSHRLILANKTDQALDLLATIYNSHYRHQADISSVYMKMFVRAFANLDNLQGVRWCILTALAGHAGLERNFIVEAHVVLGRLRKTLKGANVAKLEYLNHITDLLEKKHKGDPGMQHIHGHPHLKRRSGQRPKGAVDEMRLYSQRDVLPAIESWDDGYELMAALGQVDDGATRSEWEFQEPFQAWG